jgi:hypothetical protein
MPDRNVSPGASARLAYADPPYPGMAGLYPENTEVDHVALIAQLCEYDGWALSTDERSLAYVLPLCPSGTRVLAWCQSNAPFFIPNPARSWEPVLLWPARKRPVSVRSYLVAGIPSGRLQRDGLTGQKPSSFCEWVIRCLGAEPGDTLDDIFPGTGVMGATFQAFQSQLPLFEPARKKRTQAAASNYLRRFRERVPGLAPAPFVSERNKRIKRDAA